MAEIERQGDMIKGNNRQRLARLHAYLGLYLSLYPGERGTQNPLARQMLNEVGIFLKGASRLDVERRAKAIRSVLERAAPSTPELQPCQSPESIGEDFLQLGKAYDVWRYGVDYGWLVKRFKVPVTWIPTDLPRHARIGLGTHAGTSATEELTLLDDAFFLQAMASCASERMWTESRRISEPTSVEEHDVTRQSLTQLNVNVATYARLTVLTSVAFIEAFVNSVGANAAATKSDCDAEAVEQLNGMRKARYLSLEYKLEKFPALIRVDGRSPLRILDESQRKEPFKRFLAESKVIRDSSMHFGPTKMPIICTPQEWLRRAESALSDAMQVAQSFWTACYPEATLPSYAYCLNNDVFKERAMRRMPTQA